MANVNLFTLSRNIHSNATEKGFHNKEREIIALMEQSVNFTPEMIMAVEDAFFSQKMLLVVSEIGELVETMRKARPDFGFEGNLVEKQYHSFLNGEFDREEFEEKIKDTVGDEMADSIIRILDSAEEKGIPIVKNILLKHEFNKGREKLHGKQF